MGRGRLAVTLIGWVAALGLSIGIAAVDVAPEVAVRPWLVRNPACPLGVDIPGAITFGNTTRWQLLSPVALGGPSDYFGDDNYWETVFSIGLTPLLLAMVGAVKYPDRRLARGWIVLAGLAIWLACGRHLVLYALAFRTVPGMNWFRVPARSLFLANLAGAVLAGLGVEVLQKHLATYHDWRKLAVRFTGLFLALTGRSVLGTADSWPRRLITHGDGGESSARKWLLLADPGLHDSDRADGGCCERDSGPGVALAHGWVYSPWPSWDGTGISLLQVAPAGQFLGDDPIGSASSAFIASQVDLNPSASRHATRFTAIFPQPSWVLKRRISPTCFSLATRPASTKRSIPSRRFSAAGETTPCKRRSTTTGGTCARRSSTD